jgi:DNA-directed RNA polymerase specialized sigma24 family protein
MIEAQPQTIAGASTSSISLADLRILLREATTAARGLVRRLGLPNHEHEDLCQELLVDLIARFKWFDPGRGTLGMFAGTITRHRTKRLARRICRDRAIFPAICPDDPSLYRDRTSLRDTAEADIAVGGQSHDSFDGIEQRLDLTRALSVLRPGELSLCAKLIEHTPTEITRTGEYSRAGLYRRLRDIRLRLLEEGVSWP